VPRDDGPDDTGPVFRGNAADLAEFRLLCETPTHSDARGDALIRWQRYNTVAVPTPAARRRQKQGQRLVRKGDHVYVPRKVDLRGADLGTLSLGRVKLRGAVLDGVRVRGFFKAADFRHASLQGADLQCVQFLGTDLREADLRGADLRGASFEAARMDGCKMDAATHLQGAAFVGASLTQAVLSGADLSGCDLRGASLVRADLRGASLAGARVYGCAAWDVQLDADEALRRRLHADLSIDPGGAALPSAPSLELAQFISLLMNNPKLRDMIDSVSSRGVLILGRFTPERIAVLRALREALAAQGWYPMLFDFPPPGGRDTRETVKILGGLAAFVIADVSDASSVPLELETLVSDYTLPVVVVVQAGTRDFGMLDTLYTRAGDRLSEPNEYDDTAHLMANLPALAAWADAVRERLATGKNRPVVRRRLPAAGR
jgi:Pentapeptide repeats (8 copies)